MEAAVRRKGVERGLGLLRRKTREPEDRDDVDHHSAEEAAKDDSQEPLHGQAPRRMTGRANSGGGSPVVSGVS